MKSLLLLISLAALCLGTDKKTVAILPFDAIEVSESEATILSNKLSTELVKQGDFTVLERGEMDAILKEQVKQQSGCISSECAVEIGQILGVTHMIVGSIGKLGDIYYCEVKLVDVESSQIIRNVDEHVNGSIGDVLISAMPKLAYALAGKEIPEELESVQVVAGKPDPIITSGTAPSVMSGHGQLQIETYNVDAEIYINDELVGYEFFRSRYPVGEYTVTEKYKGRNRYQEKIKIASYSDVRVMLGPKRVRFNLVPAMSIFPSHVYRGDEHVAAWGFDMAWIKRGRHSFGASHRFHFSSDANLWGGQFDYTHFWTPAPFCKLGLGASPGFYYGAYRYGDELYWSTFHTKVEFGWDQIFFRARMDMFICESWGYYSGSSYYDPYTGTNIYDYNYSDNDNSTNFVPVFSFGVSFYL